MFQKFIAQNFQSHKYSELIFHPGVNAIVGRSNSGKTAIFRAIKLLATSRPLGNRYHSDFAKDKELTKVELQLDSGMNISTIRGNNAEYQVDKDSFKGFGSSVPDLVQKALNLSEINLQNQLDQHFLICSSPGEVARTINRIIRVDEVDGWVSNLTTVVNTEQSELRMLDSEIIGLENSISSYVYLEDFENAVVQIENIEKRLQVKTEQYFRLDQLLQRLTTIEQNIVELDKRLLLEDSITEIEDLGNQITVAVSKEEVLADYIDVCDNCEQHQHFVNALEPLLQNVNELSIDLSELTKREKALGDIIDDFQYCLNQLQVKQKDIDNVSKEMFKFLVILGKCPMCFAKLDKDRVKEIVEQ